MQTVGRSQRLSPVPWALAYTLFVVYGSLVPLEFRPVELADAWARFRDIRYLALSAGARADWIANGVLYFFLGLVWSAVVSQRRRARPVLLRVWLGCCGLAVAIEFAQVFFPPRTVSLNDLIAEAIGAAVGILLWRLSGGVFAGLVRRITAGGPSAFRSAIIAYLLGYAFLSLFPFDFVISGVELAANQYGAGAHVAQRR